MANRWEHGWYATHYLEAAAFYQAGNRRAWMPTRSGEPQTFPTMMCVPYSNRDTADVSIESYAIWLERKLEELADIMEANKSQ